MPIGWRAQPPAVTFEEWPDLSQVKAVLQAGLAQAKARGAEYADARFVYRHLEELGVANACARTPRESLDFGVGIRCLIRGSWGFASASGLSVPGVKLASAQAVKVALASASANIHPLQPPTPSSAVDTWSGPVGRDPFSVKTEEKLALLGDWEQRLRGRPEVKQGLAEAEFAKEYKVLANTVGSLIGQESYATHVHLVAAASDAGAPLVRSASFDFSKGFEAVDEIALRSPVTQDCLDGFQVAERLSVEAAALREAPMCQMGEADLILDPSQLAFQLERTVGLPLLAGGSFLSDLAPEPPSALNITSDPTIPGAPGTYGYDDEGTRGRPSVLVRRGSAAAGRSSLGRRAVDYASPPYPTLGNLVLEPGDWRTAELIRDTAQGLYLDTPLLPTVPAGASSWSGMASSSGKASWNGAAPVPRYFGTEVAWEIKDGSLGRLVRGVGYGAAAAGFWQRLDGVADREFRALWGPTRGQGAVTPPAQAVPTGFGGSPSRFRRVRVGPWSQQGKDGVQ